MAWATPAHPLALSHQHEERSPRPHAPFAAFSPCSSPSPASARSPSRTPRRPTTRWSARHRPPAAPSTPRRRRWCSHSPTRWARPTPSRSCCNGSPVAVGTPQVGIDGVSLTVSVPNPLPKGECVVSWLVSQPDGVGGGSSTFRVHDRQRHGGHRWPRPSRRHRRARSLQRARPRPPATVTPTDDTDAHRVGFRRAAGSVATADHRSASPCCSARWC